MERWPGEIVEPHRDSGQDIFIQMPRLYRIDIGYRSFSIVAPICPAGHDFASNEDQKNYKMIDSRKEIARERRRQIQIRKTFEAALGLNDEQRTGLTAFYIACGEYLVYSMDRLHAQDQIIHDFLAASVPVEDKEAHEGLATLNARQDASRIVVDTFRRAVEELKLSDTSGRSAFEQAAKEFADAFNSMMAPRRNPFYKYTDSLFVDEDWIRIADVSNEYHSTEGRLFLDVKESAPDGIDPEQYKIEHPPGG